MTPTSGSLMVTDITPDGGWRSIDVRELWRFRELMYILVWRDVKVRYKQTVLGAAWAVLQPVLMMLVFTIFLGLVAKVPAANDPVYVYAGVLPWSFFATAMANAANSLINSERLITKVYFPRLAMPLSAVGAAVVDFLIASLLLVAMMIWRGIVPGVQFLLVPVVLVFLTCAAVGVGALLAALTVAYRDFRYVVPFLVQFWLFATPSAYSRIPSDASPWLQALIVANPISGLIASFRAAAFGEAIPWGLLGTSGVLSIAALVFGCLYFKSVEDSFADLV